MSERDVPRVPEMDDALDTVIERALGRAEPPVVPAGLSGAVMTEVRSIDARFGRFERWRRAARTWAIVNSRNVDLRVRVMFTIAGVLAVVAFILAVWGPPSTSAGRPAVVPPPASPVGPTDQGIASADLQRFLNGDAWHRLMARAATRTELGKIFANPALTAALANPELLRALSDPAVDHVLGDPARQAALTGPHVAATAGDAGAVAALSNSAVDAALRNPAFKAALLDPAFDALLLDPSFETALEDRAFQGAFGHAALEASLESAIATVR